MDDFTRQVKKGKHVISSSLSEKVIVDCCKSIERNNYIDLVEYYLPHLDRLINFFPDNCWLSYHKGKLLLLQGRNIQAREFILPITRLNKQSWAWSLLGDTFPEDDIDNRICCYINGVLSSNDEGFIPKVRLKLANEFIKLKLFSNAKLEIDKVISFKKQNNYRLEDDIIELQSKDWYNSSTTPKNNIEIYNLYTKNSESILYGTLPYIDGVLDGINIEKSRAYFLLKYNEEIIRNSIDLKFMGELKGLPLGTPLKVKMDNIGGSLKIYKIEERNGELWDILNWKNGIIDNINYEKNLFHVLFDKNDDVVIKFNDFNEKYNLSIGLSVECKTKNINGRQKVLIWKVSDQYPPDTLYKKFTGAFRDPDYNNSDNLDENDEKDDLSDSVCETFGFLKGNSEDVYISKELVDYYQLRNNQKISCEAIRSKSKKGVWGWKALKVNILEV